MSSPATAVPKPADDIERLLVETQGGTIGLTSAGNQGATFFFTLPRLEVD